MTLAGNVLSRLGPLPRLVQLRQGQTFDSYCSSLAARNGFGSVSHLRLILGLGLATKEPSPTEVQAFATLGGLDGDALDRSVIRIRDGLFAIGGEMVRETLRVSSSQMRVCPECISNDCASLAPGLARNAAPYTRDLSEFEAINGCPTHGLAFVDAAVDESNPRDLCHHLRKRAKDGLSLPCLPIELGPAELYFASRLSGKVGDDTPLLNSMTFIDAVDTTALLGGMIECGPTGSFSHRASYSPAQRRYYEAGFDVARHGEKAIREALTKVVEASLPSERSGSGLQRVFGTLARNLSASKGNELQALRRIVADLALDHDLPRWAATSVLRIPIDSREVLSVAAAANQFGVDARVLGQVLEDIGAIPLSNEPQAATFRVSDHRSLIQDLAMSLNLTQTARLLGVSSKLVVAFQEQGLLAPLMVRSSNDGKPLRHFKPNEIDRFRREMTKYAMPASSVTPNHCPLETAAMSAGRSSDLLFSLVREGRLTSLLIRKPDGNLGDLLIDVDEVRSLVRRSDGGEMSVYQASSAVGISAVALRKLAAVGAIENSHRPNPVNLRPQLTFATADVEKFRTAYIDLSRLRRLNGKHGRALKRELAVHGVQPAFDPLQAGVTIFRRSQIPSTLKQEPTG